MKKINDVLIFVIGILLFLISYSFDVQISLFFKNVKFPVFDFVLGIVTNFGVAVLVTLLIPSIILFKKNKKIVYLLWLTFLISFVLAFVIKLIVIRQRPIETFAYPFTSIPNYSFPSMHSMVAFSLLPLLVKYMPRHRYSWIAFAFFVGFSRVFFGFHFLSDVVFGALSGYVIGDYLLELYEKKKLWIK